MKVKDVTLNGRYIANVSNNRVLVTVLQVIETTGHGKFSVRNEKTQRIITVSAMRLTALPVKKVQVSAQ
jgi:hypothetical protein